MWDLGKEVGKTCQEAISSGGGGGRERRRYAMGDGRWEIDRLVKGCGQEMDRWRWTFLRRNGASRLVAILPGLSGLGV